MATVEQAYQWFQSGELPACEQACRALLLADERTAGAYHLLGLIALSRQQNELAVGHLRAAVRWSPEAAPMQIELGNVLRMSGLLDEAEGCYRRAAQIDPQSAVAHNNLGNVLRDQRRTSEALASLQQAARILPEAAVVQVNLGECYQALEMLAAAADAYQRAVHLDATLVIAQFKLAVVLQRMNDPRAREVYRGALRLAPGDVDLHRAAGIALHVLGEKEDAEACYRRVLAARPADHLVLHNLACCLMDKLELEGAERLFRQCILNTPQEAKTYFHLATCLVHQGRYADSIGYYRQAIQCAPDNPEIHYDFGMACLMLGDYARGWPEFDWRLKVDANHAQFGVPWRGEPLAGRTLTLQSEGGLGDTLQFIRFAPLVQNPGGQVRLDVQPGLVPLLEQSGFNNVVPRGEPAADPRSASVSLLSLPQLFGTTDETIPARVPYLHASRQDIEHWRSKLALHPGFRIGIHWRGSAIAERERRGLPLEKFAIFWQVPGVVLFNLQQGAEAQVAAWDQGSRLVCFDDLDRRGAFLDTAAIMENLDLIITCDTAVAHLAGALARPVWVALSIPWDWRWQLDRDDTPWYPTMRLFRKRKPGDWDEVLERMAAALRFLVANRQPARIE